MCLCLLSVGSIVLSRWVVVSQSVSQINQINQSTLETKNPLKIQQTAAKSRPSEQSRPDPPFITIPITPSTHHENQKAPSAPREAQSPNPTHAPSEGQWKFCKGERELISRTHASSDVWCILPTADNTMPSLERGRACASDALRVHAHIRRASYEKSCTAAV